VTSLNKKRCEMIEEYKCRTENESCEFLTAAQLVPGIFDQSTDEFQAVQLLHPHTLLKQASGYGFEPPVCLDRIVTRTSYLGCNAKAVKEII
jgi:hypothetical protein